METIIATEIGPNGIDAEIVEYLEHHQEDLSLTDSTLYYGFPVFRDYDDSNVRASFCILSKHHGIVLINTAQEHLVHEHDENLTQLYSYVEAAIKKSKNLRLNKKELALPVDSFLYLHDYVKEMTESLDNELLVSMPGIGEMLNSRFQEQSVEATVLHEARSIIEGARALNRASKRTKTSDDPNTKSNILIELENEVSNFDVEQRRIAISLINGPQRIRGLAGSGKTVVLAMKAAHIHLQHPDKKILFTFYTKSLYGLIRESIARFYRHFAGDEPNWDYIDVLHSWGGRSIDGVCFNACLENTIASMTFSEAKALDSKDPFKEVCKHIGKHYVEPKYDYILIDEAQDLPNEFFQLCYKLANGEHGREKNIVWAYDDLQSIFHVYQRTPEELFGNDENDNPRIDLLQFSAELAPGQSNDLVLYKCYRNPLEVLVTAHALGFAIYADEPVQTLENKEHWLDVGYSVEGDKDLVVGETVTVTRDRENSPLSIYKHQDVSEIIKCHLADGIEGEIDWVVEYIFAALSEGVKPHDILVISLDDRYAKSYFSRISYLLIQEGIRSNNLLTSNSAAPPFMLDDMVTLSTVHRAKGNEAALVFVLGVDAIYPNRKTRNARNRLFTAFTRTRAWLRVSGVGDRAQFFFNEIERSIENSPSLIFEVPDPHEIEMIQRDLSSKPREFLKLQELVKDLKEQGFTEEEIQMELNLSGSE